MLSTPLRPRLLRIAFRAGQVDLNVDESRSLSSLCPDKVITLTEIPQVCCSSSGEFHLSVIKGSQLHVSIASGVPVLAGSFLQTCRVGGHGCRYKQAFRIRGWDNQHTVCSRPKKCQLKVALSVLPNLTDAWSAG